jgi:RNA polymerase sigma factor (sigma-70 family)
VEQRVAKRQGKDFRERGRDCWGGDMKIGVKLKATLKNHNLFMARVDCGYKKVSDFVKALNVRGRISYNTYLSVENMKRRPGAKTVMLVCNFLGMDKEYLFPKVSQKTVTQFNKLNKQLYLIAEAEKFISGSERNRITLFEDETKLLVSKAICDLDLREQTIIKKRFFEEKTFEDVSEELMMTRERVRQIEYKALRNLRNSDLIKEAEKIIGVE